jgi:hypothetical protein
MTDLSAYEFSPLRQGELALYLAQPRDRRRASSARGETAPRRGASKRSFIPLHRFP